MSTTITGNLTRDPELTFTASGIARATFGVAVTRRRKKGDEWEEQVSYFDCVAWRELAENIGESLTKGDTVIVQGRFEQRSWEGKDGSKRSAVELAAEEVGPSLRRATCSVTRNERRGGQDSGSGRGRARSSSEYGEEPQW